MFITSNTKKAFPQAFLLLMAPTVQAEVDRHDYPSIVAPILGLTAVCVIFGLVTGCICCCSCKGFFSEQVVGAGQPLVENRDEPQVGEPQAGEPTESLLANSTASGS